MNYFIDPRYAIIKDRLRMVNSIIGFVSNKGGVGKSVIASMTALLLGSKGYHVGLFDMDFTNPSCHIILGVKDIMPIEEKGIIPPEVHKIKFMSITYYSRDNPLPLRGHDITNIILELLAITRWEHLDFLILDMPPGLGDEILDAIRFIEKLDIIVVTAPSKLSIASASRLVRMIKITRKNILGIILNENAPSLYNINAITSTLRDLNIPLLGVIHYDPNLEEALGDCKKLLNTKFRFYVEKCIDKILKEHFSP